MNEFYIGNIRVDADRCRVHRETGTLSLEPKVIQVLLFLAQHQGEVVSHRTLLDAVWPHTIVEPSALQRCIVQLRKAFDDDVKKQIFIATFPKRGYSLVPPVSWQQPAARRWHLPFFESVLYRRPAMAMLGGLAAVLLALAYVSTRPGDTPQAPAPSEVDYVPAMSSLAQTASLPEAVGTAFYAAYSPNGHFVVFPRLQQGRLGHLFARDLTNSREYRLTPDAGYYEFTAWSQDSRKLAYVEVDCSTSTCESRQCSSLVALDFSSPDEAALATDELLACDEYLYRTPQWIGETAIAFVESSPQRAALVRLDTNSMAREVIYTEPGKLPYHLAYSPDAGMMAATMSNAGGGQELLLVNTLTWQTFRFNLDTELLGNEALYPTWNPQADGLLVSTSRGMFTISLDGEVTAQSFPYMPSLPSGDY